MKVFFRVFLTLILPPLLVGGFLFHLNQKGFFDLQEVRVVLEGEMGASLHLKPLVEELESDMQTQKGRSLWTLDLSEISEVLEQKTWIEDHSLSREWPNALVVTLKPQEVKALLLSKKQLVPVIHEGRLLNPIEAKLAPDVVVLEGAAFENETLRRKAVQVLSEIPEVGAFSRETISEMRWNRKEGFWVTMIRHSTEVKLGEEAVAIKAARLGQVLEYLNNRGMSARSLDANLSKKVLVRLTE